MVGICSCRGKLQSFRKMLLQEVPTSKWIVITKTSYTAIVTRKQRPVIFSDVNFRIFMKPTIMQQQTISLRMMFLWLKNQPRVRAMPTNRLASYCACIWRRPRLKRCVLRDFCRSRKRSQLQQMVTPTMPSTKLTMLSVTIMPSEEKKPIRPPSMSRTLNRMISQTRMVSPMPRKDQAREQTATTAMSAVMKTISMSSPHSKVLETYWSLQMTQQFRVQFFSSSETERTSSSKQLKKLTLGRWQWFWMEIVQEGERQVVWLRVGRSVSWTVLIEKEFGCERPDTTIEQLALVLYSASFWVQLKRGLSEQSKVESVDMKRGWDVPLTIMAALQLRVVMLMLSEDDCVRMSAGSSESRRIMGAATFIIITIDSVQVILEYIKTGLNPSRIK